MENLILDEFVGIGIKDMCNKCANQNSLYCNICQNGDFFMTDKQKKDNDMMCDLLCGNDE